MNLAHLRAWRKAWFVTNDIEANAALEIADRAAAAKDVRALLAMRVHATEQYEKHRAVHMECMRATPSLNLYEAAKMELWDAVRAYGEVCLDQVHGVETTPATDLRDLFVGAAGLAEVSEAARIITAEHWQKVVVGDAMRVEKRFRRIEEESWEAHIVKGGG